MHKLIQTENMKRLTTGARALIEAEPGEPRLGLVYGTAGLGKTRAVDHLATQSAAAYVRAAREWSPNAMMADILDALGEEPGWGAAKQLGRAAEVMAGRLDDEGYGHGLLIIDEADYLVKGVSPPNTPRLLDTVRDLHDLSGAPILLVGMDRLANVLSRFKQFWDRVLAGAVVEFRPVGVAETGTLAKEVYGLKLEGPVAQAVHAATEGNLRETVQYAKRLARLVKANDAKPSREMVAHVQARIHAVKRRLAGRPGLRAA